MGLWSANSVDILYMATHGGSDAVRSRWPMWDNGTRAFTSNMRLGDDSRQLMVLATYSCNTQRIDNDVWTRWRPAFSGGLVITVGGHGLLYFGSPHVAGPEFARRMQAGETIGNAWLNSAWYATNMNQPGIIVTGANRADCESRANVSLRNLFSTPVLRDGQIGSVCWVTWN